MPASVATAQDLSWELRDREVESFSLWIRWVQAPKPGGCSIPCGMSSHASPLQGRTSDLFWTGEKWVGPSLLSLPGGVLGAKQGSVLCLH